MEKFSANMVLLEEHINHVHAQNNALHQLWQEMTNIQCMIQMDFAENSMVSYRDEPQSVYYSKKGITVHPVVIDFNKEGMLKHTSLGLV